jgi:7,8-dihydro-6-hydroxymethylpterin dimethyltransferase
MRCLEEQTGRLVKVSDFSPPGCEHAHCSTHATYVHLAEGGLRLIGAAEEDSCCSADTGTRGVRRTVETVSRRWQLPSAAPDSNRLPLAEETSCCGGSNPDVTRVEGPLDLDVFLKEVGTRSFTISAMAFQDADNLDLERLMGCCISVISPDGMLVPFCAYNLTSREGKGLYRRRNGLGSQ